jgi:hypothetical protein
MYVYLSLNIQGSQPANDCALIPAASKAEATEKPTQQVKKN